MDRRALDHLLQPDERRAFEDDGYVLLPTALNAESVQSVAELSLREFATYREQEDVTPWHGLNLHDLIGRHPGFLDLIDLPTTLPKVWGVLGWHIQLFHTQLLVTPPAPEGAAAGAYGWHQDNNRMNLDLETTPQPRVSVKVGYFLSDVSAPGMANLCVVPGSHLRGRPSVPTGEQPDGAIEVLAEAGDAVLFDRRLWHSASTNCSSSTRIFLTYGYSYRWLRPKSAMHYAGLAETVDPIRRQLLGVSSDANAYFDPRDEDVPLREWIRVHVGEDALVP